MVRARAYAAASQPRPNLQSRDSSPELGSPSRVTRVNKRTGRPIRKSAGRSHRMDGYIDSSLIEEEEPDLMEYPSEDEEGEKPKTARGRKRKRVPSPTPPPTEPFSYFEAPDEETDDESNRVIRRPSNATGPVVLQFNIPLGFHGPLLVKLNGDLLREPRAFDLPAPPLQTEAEMLPPSTNDSGAKSFDKIPPEIRNKIYQLLFKADNDLDIASPSNFCRSGQFLRTCKLIHSEGCSVLYGENTFALSRNRASRSPFWNPIPKEIGYQDVRQFLKVIGPANLAYLRDIKITLEDAAPSLTPYLTHENRRYINDPHLIDCFRILRQAKLRKVKLTFLGRRHLLKTDNKFLGYLERIKADLVTTEPPNRWYFQKIMPSTFDEIQELMTRKRKLYLDE
ncbi:hypothetical protein BU24DRAFT_353309 [Aaosphaeria arxii CBS 175.79]|uniref:F-box domain-containing protein n=1 Tax=Aaosphaeria arxii CBS 175.79 TaxID=1450172 RepID=A0A6A5XHL6_9PLEO|nr:uncharacterized protein BU24DRAFT_353309 [Aaosphaeria arxii CBS 175.79]KAF2012346.1 hypothetical protein BU24DRAFT_353309 [Aaosphaeria arxii CBS 175.79]